MSIIKTDNFQLKKEAPLDSRDVRNDIRDPEGIKQVGYPYEGQIIYLSQLKKYFAITSYDSENEEIKSYVQISMPMIDISNALSTTGSTINNIFWPPAEIMFYDNKGYKYDYNIASDNTQWLVSHPYYVNGDGIEAGYWIKRIKVDYSNNKLTLIEKTIVPERINTGSNVSLTTTF